MAYIAKSTLLLQNYPFIFCNRVLKRQGKPQGNGIIAPPATIYRN
jgi:hypothetical protein